MEVLLLPRTPVGKHWHKVTASLNISSIAMVLFLIHSHKNNSCDWNVSRVISFNFSECYHEICLTHPWASPRFRAILCRIKVLTRQMFLTRFESLCRMCSLSFSSCWYIQTRKYFTLVKKKSIWFLLGRPQSTISKLGDAWHISYCHQQFNVRRP